MASQDRTAVPFEVLTVDSDDVLSWSRRVTFAIDGGYAEIELSYDEWNGYEVTAVGSEELPEDLAEWLDDRDNLFELDQVTEAIQKETFRAEADA